MNEIKRRDFIAGAVTAGAAYALSSGAANAAEGRSVGGTCALPVPDGPEFAGMAGAYAALVTPYKKDGSINEEMIERVMEYGIANGLKGFYLTGSTGEGLLLSKEERKLVYSRAVKVSRGRAKLIAHIGAMSTEDSVELARYAEKAGCDWVSSVAPVYFGQTFDLAYAHYEAISDAVGIPFMIYARNQQIDPARDVRFFDIKNVKGMKYTGYAYWTVKMMKKRLPKSAIFFAGADEQELCAFAYGDVFSGCIGTTDNMIPALHAEVCRLAGENRFAEASDPMDKIARFVELVAGVDFSLWKSAMRYLGMDCGPARSPAGRRISEDDYRAYAEKLDALGFLKRGDVDA
jgi:N-acetylneuraminate lyase